MTNLNPQLSSFVTYLTQTLLNPPGGPPGQAQYIPPPPPGNIRVGPPPPALLNINNCLAQQKDPEKDAADKKKVVDDSKIKFTHLEQGNLPKYLEVNHYRPVLNDIPEISKLHDAIVPPPITPNEKCKDIILITSDEQGLFRTPHLNEWRVTEVYDDNTVLLQKNVKDNYVAEPLNKDYIDELVAYQKRTEELKIAVSSNIKATEEATKSTDADLNLIGALCLENKKLRTELQTPFVYKGQQYPKSTILTVWRKTLRLKFGWHLIDNQLLLIQKVEKIDTATSSDVQFKGIIYPESVRLSHPGSSNQGKNDYLSFLQRIQIGDFVDAIDGGQFYPSVIKQLDVATNKKISRIEIHYLGWSSAYDRWITVLTGNEDEIKKTKLQIDRLLSQCTGGVWQHFLNKLTPEEQNLYKIQIEQFKGLFYDSSRPDTQVTASPITD